MNFSQKLYSETFTGQTKLWSSLALWGRRYLNAGYFLQGEKWDHMSWFISTVPFNLCYLGIRFSSSSLLFWRYSFKPRGERIFNSNIGANLLYKPADCDPIEHRCSTDLRSVSAGLTVTTLAGSLNALMTEARCSPAWVTSPRIHIPGAHHFGSLLHSEQSQWKGASVILAQKVMNRILQLCEVLPLMR